jgi:Tol biopolymer transport system component
MRCCLLILAVLAAACGPKSVSAMSTTTAHKGATHAPPPPNRNAKDTSGDTPVPKSTDAAEMLAVQREGSIYLLTPAGEEERRLTYRAQGSNDESPSFSPHGDAVAYTSARDGASKIYVVALDGTGSRAVTDGADGGDREPSWSPDGRRIVFVRGQEHRDLYVVDFDKGSSPTKILAATDVDAAHAGAPSWSPDGEEIVFSGDRAAGQGTGLWLVKPDGTGLKRLTRPPASESWIRDLHPTWSPDGKRIAFASNRHATTETDAGDLDIYDVTIADGTIRRLTRDPAIADEPSYSPDGKRLYFASTREQARAYAIEIYVMAAEGGQQDRLTRDEIPQNAAPSAGRVQAKK